jgi:hypothetical protein
LAQQEAAERAKAIRTSAAELGKRLAFTAQLRSDFLSS